MMLAHSYQEQDNFDLLLRDSVVIYYHRARLPPHTEMPILSFFDVVEQKLEYDFHHMC